MDEELLSERFNKKEVSLKPLVSSARKITKGCGPRWALKRLNKDLLDEASIVETWVCPPKQISDVEEEADSFIKAVTRICNTAMPRVKSEPRKKLAYWWTDVIAQMRQDSNAKRRLYTRFRRRRNRPSDAQAKEEELYRNYKATISALSAEIERTKSSIYEDLLEILESDPWRRPDIVVKEKLRERTPPLTVTLQPEVLENVLTGLLSTRAKSVRFKSPLPLQSYEDDADVPEVTKEEVDIAARPMQEKCTAPGPDGIPGQVLALLLEELGPRLRILFSTALKQGQFPKRWKNGKLVLIKKEKLSEAESPYAYQAIILLDETSKLFERIIANRLTGHLMALSPDLTDEPDGFSRERLAVDAMMRAKRLVDMALLMGHVSMAVSLEIPNGMTTLPWSCVKKALLHYQVPVYLQQLIRSYLSNRAVVYPRQDGWFQRDMSCIVPQGTVLGPLLWKLTYDWVLRGALLPDVEVICFDDSTLVIVDSSTYRDVSILTTAAVAHFVGRIRRYGLKVNVDASKAICIYGSRKAPPFGSQIIVGGVSIPVDSTMDYLGLNLDGRWTFRKHLRSLAGKLQEVPVELSKLSENLSTRYTSSKRLFMGIMRSMALFSAPVWADAITGLNRTLLQEMQYDIALSLIKGEHTIPFQVVCVLAGVLPWDLEVKALASLYQWRQDAIDNEQRPDPKEFKGRWTEFRQIVIQAWATKLAQSVPGREIAVAISPFLDEWLTRPYGVFNSELTQMLTGHGCFGKYLCDLGWEETPECRHCKAQEDTAVHTLLDCEAWTEERFLLVSKVGNLSLSDLIPVMIRSKGAWDAVVSFCHTVMSRKEEAVKNRGIFWSSRFTKCQ